MFVVPVTGPPLPQSGDDAHTIPVRSGRRLLGRVWGSKRRSEARLARILDLFEEHVYAGEITPDGRYVHHTSTDTLGGLIGGSVPDGVETGEFWESRIPAQDRAAYEAFNRSLLRGEDAEATYRIAGLDGTTRILRDRARPRRKADGGMLVDGIISDITAREEAAARLAEASDRFTSLLDVVGAHVYLALALPDGSLEELFQGPGGDRLLGGAEPDPGMVNWDAAVHPDDRAAYDEFNLALGAGRGRRRDVPADRRRRDHALGARPGGLPAAPRRHVRGERHRLGRHRAAPARGRPAAEHGGASSSAPAPRPSCAPAPTSSRAPSTAATSPRSPPRR